jgi:prephenate dehydrogenase
VTAVERPVVGIVGSQGAFGRWLRAFFEQRMGLRVLGRDPAGETGLSERALVEACDVLVFSAPIRHTSALIRDYTRIAAGAERGRLWLDLTSIKAAPVAALLASQAEAVGLHPMTAPPKSPTLRGRTMAVCEARLEAWRPWLQRFLDASEAECVRIEPERHDRAMALVQGLVHAVHMAQGAVLRELAPAVGGLAGLAPLRTVGYALDTAVTGRILAGNPAIYEDIQFENPHVAPMLECLAAQLDALRDHVRQGDGEARGRMREALLGRSADFFGKAALAEGSYAFERLGYLLADLAEPQYLSVFLPQDRPGSLRVLLSVFEARGINLESIHSSRSADGELHFRIAVARDTDPQALAGAMAAIEGEGIGRVVDSAAVR